MSLRILFFSKLRDIVGADEIVFEVAPDVADVAGLLEALYSRWPGLREWDASLRVAIDLEYVDREAALVPGGEIAVMPPVQGG